MVRVNTVMRGRYGGGGQAVGGTSSTSFRRQATSAPDVNRMRQYRGDGRGFYSNFQRQGSNPSMYRYDITSRNSVSVATRQNDSYNLRFPPIANKNEGRYTARQHLNFLWLKRQSRRIRNNTSVQATAIAAQAAVARARGGGEGGVVEVAGEHGRSAGRPRGGRRRGGGNARVTKEGLDAALEKYMGDDAKKHRLDGDLDSYFGRPAEVSKVAEAAVIDAVDDSAVSATL